MKKLVISIIILCILSMTYFIGNIIFLTKRRDSSNALMNDLSNIFKIESKIQMNEKSYIFFLVDVQRFYCPFTKYC